MDENKPDALVLKQIQGWEMSWSSSDKDGKNTWDDLSSNIEELSFVPTDLLHGTLTWKGDYMIAEVNALCCWENSESATLENTKKGNQEGSLYFILKAGLRFRTKHDVPGTVSSPNKSDHKAHNKIRQKMIKRLQEDAYIKKLLADNKDDRKQQFAVLCEARVTVSKYLPPDTATGTSPSETHHHQQSLEERVDLADAVAEGIRRAVFSQAESSLDVVEVLLTLPFLPGSAHHDIVEENDNPTINCPLADRAKLRLLEDAMCDACEREGEDEILDDLKISSSHQDNHAGGDDSASDKSNPPPPLGGGHKHSKSHQNKSNKRTKR